MRLTLAAVALLTVFATASADAPPVAPPQAIEFDTMNEAAVHALQLVAHISEAYEYGGVISQMADGKFAVSEPETFYRGDAVNIDEDPLVYDGRIVATYHTHPCLPESHIPSFFSPQDLMSARVTGHVSYMADLCTGDVHRWRPGVDGYEAPPVSDLGLILGPPMGKGQVVGHITVTLPKPLENTRPGSL